MRRVAPALFWFGTCTALAVAGQWWLSGRAAPAGHALIPPVEPAAPTGPRAIPPHRPEGYRPTVDTGWVTPDGTPVTVSCMTCHATREPDRHQGLEGSTPVHFHQGLHYAHGGLSCLSCHHAEDYDALRLADGRRLPFAQAQLLCAQCHGPQTRDYLHGSHGGMVGAWDQPQGDRHRLTCTDCHDPHAPAYPAWLPIFAPRDEGAEQQRRRAERPSSR